jgi:hypothetical protein
MTAFEFLSVALSFVLGLAVTLVLTSFLAAFRARSESRMDWLPFAWSSYVLANQFQYWWAIFELSSMPEWTIATFGMLLLLAVILFVAGGLTLPTGSGEYPHDLREYFRRDGKWGVVALASYGIVGTVGNVILFDTPLVSALHAIQVGAVGAAIAVASAKSRPVQVTGTLLFGVLLILALILATPWAY